MLYFIQLLFVATALVLLLECARKSSSPCNWMIKILPYLCSAEISGWGVIGWSKMRVTRQDRQTDRQTEAHSHRAAIGKRMGRIFGADRETDLSRQSQRMHAFSCLSFGVPVTSMDDALPMSSLSELPGMVRVQSDSVPLEWRTPSGSE